MTLLKLRFVLGTVALVSVVVMGVLLVFFGHDISPVQVALIASVIAILGAEVKSSSSWAFDGVPVEPNTKSTTVSEVKPPADPEPAQAPAFPVPPNP